jgi:hypothetical protein
LYRLVQACRRITGLLTIYCTTHQPVPLHQLYKYQPVPPHACRGQPAHAHTCTGIAYTSLYNRHLREKNMYHPGDTRHRALGGIGAHHSQRNIRSKSWEKVTYITREALDTPWCHYQTLAPTQEGEKPAPEAKNDREKGQNGHATPPGNTGTEISAKICIPFRTTARR